MGYINIAVFSAEIKESDNMSQQKYYITTPIYYPSGKWHLGTCYTTVICDALARFKRMQGYDVFYLTGTDEHGQKIDDVAKSVGVPVKEYIDKVVKELKELWGLLDISYDKFIRTTDDYHEKAVQKIFEKLYEQGDIYKDEYEGYYCKPCESFWTKSQLVDGKCPDCGREVSLMKEESYFFRLSKYQDRLIKLIEENPEFLQPKSRQNEMLNNFLRPGLQDISVSRTSFDWGVKVPFDPKHVVYVWIDALTNYITALGYGSDDTTLFDKYWPADIHMMGKEIVRFHSIIWPAILMALDIPLPKKVYGHGWLLLSGDKISKSKGNAVDPVILSERYGVDAVRYYLLREIPFGQDGSYSNRAFISRINSDLANDFGNLVSRSTAMCSQYFGGIVPERGEIEEVDKSLIDVCNGAYEKVAKAMDSLLVPEALEEIWKIIIRANKYIDETTPWLLAKDESKRARLQSVIYNLIEAIRMANVLVSPFLTKSYVEVFKKIGVTDEYLEGFGSLEFGAMRSGAKVEKGEALFKRIDIEKDVKELEAIAEKAEAEKNKKAEKKEDEKAENTVTFEEITIDDFAKINLRVGKVASAEKVEKADKLLKLGVDLGEGRIRTVVSGIAKWYAPDEMVGKEIILVANLKPCKLRGIMSEGMILCASDEDGNLAIVSPSKPMKAGSEVR
ncbi:MAG: methionine--tRNA ligase [Clostridia bacterium]|jgi:methionyl-tRNA synthetase|nr:methionine--tRNA ligase [Clostridia bacterium]